MWNWVVRDNRLYSGASSRYFGKNSTPELVREGPREGPHKTLHAHADAKLATVLGPAQQRAEDCKIDASPKQRVIYNSPERIYNICDKKSISI